MAVIVNTKDGATRSFDLGDEQQLRGLRELLRSGLVTALSIHHKGLQNSLPQPKRFGGGCFYGAEPIMNGSSKPIGERVFCHAGDVRVSLSATYEGSVVRCDLVRAGRMRYNPGSKR